MSNPQTAAPVPAEGAEQAPSSIETSHVAQLISESCSGLNEEIIGQPTLDREVIERDSTTVHPVQAATFRL